jgi:hypothetical protein
MPEGLKLIVSSDVTQAEQNLKKFVATAGKEGERAATSLSTGLNKVNPAATKTFNNLSNQAKAAVKPISTLGDSIETLRAKLLARKEFLIRATDINQIRQYNGEIKALEVEIARLGAVGGSSMGNIATNASKAFSILRTAAQILPGIGIAGIFGALFTGISSVISQLFKSGDALAKSQLALENYTISIKGLKEELDDLEDSLDFTSKLRALNAEIRGLTGGELKLFKSQDERDDLDKVIEKAIDNKNKLKREVDQIKSILKGAGFELKLNKAGLIPDLGDGLSEQQKAFNETVKQFAEAEKKVLELQRKAVLTDNEIQKDRNDIAEEAAKKAEELRKKNLDDFEKFIAATIAKAEKLSSFLDKRGILNIGAGFKFDPTKSKIENLEAAQSFIGKALNAKFPFIEVVMPPLKFVNPNDAKFEAEIVTTEEKILAQLKKAVSKTPAIVPIPIDPQIIIRAEKLQSAVDNVNSIIKQAINDSFANIGEVLGTALAGGDIQKGMQAFVGIIGNALQAIGKQLIVVSGIAETVQVSLGQLFTNPGLALAAGVALVAAGAALKKTLSKGVTGFAEGGLVFGPTMGLVGEGRGTTRSNPEVIAPLDKLQAMLGNMGGGKPQLLFAKIKGNDILLSNNRTNKYNRR